MREGRQREEEGAKDKANRNWFRGQSCLLLTMHSATPTFVPTWPLPLSPYAFATPRPPPDLQVPSRQPALGTSFIPDLQPFLFLLFMPQTLMFPTSFPYPWNLSFTPTLSSHSRHKPSPKYPIPQYNSIELPCPLHARKKRLLCAGRYLKPFTGE